MKAWDVVEVEGYRILVGRSAHANDGLTFGVGRPRDLWLHVQGQAGSHVLVQAADDGKAVPPAVVHRAAELAAWHSKARDAGGKVAVSVARVSDVHKARGSPAGLVHLARHRTLRVYPRGP